MLKLLFEKGTSIKDIQCVNRVLYINGNSIPVYNISNYYITEERDIVKSIKTGLKIFMYIFIFNLIVSLFKLYDLSDLLFIMNPIITLVSIGFIMRKRFYLNIYTNSGHRYTIKLIIYNKEEINNLRVKINSAMVTTT